MLHGYNSVSLISTCRVTLVVLALAKWHNFHVYQNQYFLNQHLQYSVLVDSCDAVKHPGVPIIIFG